MQNSPANNTNTENNNQQTNDSNPQNLQENQDLQEEILNEVLNDEFEEFEELDVEEDEEETSEKEEEQKLPKYGCSHYERKCEIFAKCCNKFYPCRHCHNEDNSFGKTAHEIDRYAVDKVKCLLCKTEQEISNECKNCHVQFARYYCSICKFFDDKEGKQIYHCDGCKLCRVGNKEDYYHCNTCGYCISKDLKDNHKCIERGSHHNCPVCLEFLFSSTKPFTILPCGHTIHSHCKVDMMKSGCYTCPICSKSMVDLSIFTEQLDKEIENTPMPDEYKDMKVDILCNECQTKANVSFHIFGLKCPKCGSYNTKRIKT